MHRFTSYTYGLALASLGCGAAPASEVMAPRAPEAAASREASAAAQSARVETPSAAAAPIVAGAIAPIDSADATGFGGVGLRSAPARSTEGEVITPTAPEPSRGIPQITVAPPSVGDIDRDLVKRVVRRRSPALRACYEAALAKDPTEQGRISVKFTIAGDGAVTDAKATDTSLKSTVLIACVLQEFRAMVFPSFSGTVHINYPIVFRPESP